MTITASVLDLIARIAIVLNRGIRAWKDDEFADFLGEWVVIPLIVVGLSAAVYFISKFLKNKSR